MNPDKPMKSSMHTNTQHLELWGGIECTINRIKNKYFDQLEYAGFYERKDDIDAIIALGIKALRYPILWEKHQPKKNLKINWERAESDLKKLSNHNVEPIVGLVHHGSGPAHVNFFDGSFETGLAEYAKKVAQQFPNIKYYTPVNEPLTTARFCGLYGHWYPHKKNDFGFAKILISECKAIVLAMNEIRRVNPEAKLIQTEDIGKTHSTPVLAYQAAFENNRRWLTFDLLCGKVKPDHVLWDYLTYAGIDENDLYFFLQHSCPPDILGCNYYITSERFLDERLEIYPLHTHGKNFRHEYADVEAVRVNEDAFSGPGTVIKELWEQYEVPIAVTEVHLHCHRDEQARWFNYVWTTANKLREKNINIIAVTAWALLGSFGWNKLLTQPNGDYEPGVFNVQSGVLRPVLLANLLKQIANNQSYYHPVLNRKGWWQRDLRILYPSPQPKKINEVHTGDITGPLLILGKTGTLGNAFAKSCESRNINYKLLGRNDVDIRNEKEINEIICKLKPWAIINAAGYVRVDDAETDVQNCFAVNSYGPAYLAKRCNEHNIQLLSFSSDLVFNGQKKQPYTENDTVGPLNVYGSSKVVAEQNILKFFPGALIVRSSAFFGPWDEFNFIAALIKHLKNNKPFAAANDVVISPTYTPDLANASLDLLLDNEKGIFHVANEGEITWAELATTVATKLNLNTALIQARPLHELRFTAKRPLYSVLKSNKGIRLPALNDALERFYSEIKYSFYADNYSIA